MFSWLSSSAPAEQPKEESKNPVPYPELGKEYSADHCFDELMMYYEARDTQEWRLEINEPNLQQSFCYFVDRPVLMMKAFTNIKSPMQALYDVCVNFDIRQQWDKNVADFKIYHQTADQAEMRLSYRFLSMAPLITSDRDFYVWQLIRRDYPQKGDVSIYTKSLPDHPECPTTYSPVRAKIFISAFIFRPKVDEAGQQTTDFFMVTQVDVAGWIPKTLVNTFSTSVPRKTFQQLEVAANDYHSKMAQQAKL